MIKRVAGVLKGLVPLIVGVFIAREIIENWEEVEAADWSFDPLFLVISFVLAVPWFAGRPEIWRRLLANFGYSIPFRVSFRIMRHAELSRYVPGAIWQYVGRIYLAGRWGVPAAVTIAATMFETVLLVLAAIVPAFWQFQEITPDVGGYYRVMLLAFPVVAVLLLHPRVVNLWASYLSRRLKQPGSEFSVPWRVLLGIWIADLGLWVTYGLSIALFARAVIPIDVLELPLIASNYAAAWLVGMFTVIAPGGLGIRDGALGLLLSLTMPKGVAFTLAVGVRVWLTAVEVVCAAPSLFVEKGPKEGEEEAAQESGGPEGGSIRR